MLIKFSYELLFLTNLFIFTDAVHVSGGSSAHRQEHITVHTAATVDETKR